MLGVVPFRSSIEHIVNARERSTTTPSVHVISAAREVLLSSITSVVCAVRDSRCNKREKTVFPYSMVSSIASLDSKVGVDAMTLAPSSYLTSDNLHDHIAT